MKKTIISLTVAVLLCFVAVTTLAQDVLVSSFDAEDISGYMGHNTGQQSYGITDPVVTLSQGDNGNGAKVEIGKTDSINSTVQDFRIKDSNAINSILNNYSSDKFFKIYIDASGCNFNLVIRFSFRPESGRVDFDCSNATLIALDGTRPSFDTEDDSTSANENAKIVIPVGFKGHIYLPFSALGSSLDGVNSLRYIGFDVRWNSQAGDAYETDETQGYYILDSAMVVDEIPAQQNPSQQPSQEPSVEPTVEPSVEPSVEISDNNSDNKDDSSSTADVSVLGYALSAILGCGAVIVAKRR